jgi:hypothetical protein
MAEKRPLCIYHGRIEELRPTDTLPGSGGGSPPNYLGMAYPKRLATPKIVGDMAGAPLTTLALTPSRQYFVPLAVPRQTVLSALRISVTTATAGAANFGIYNNTQVNGNDTPGTRVAQIHNVRDTGTTGDKTGYLSLTLQPGVLYWASLICSAAATIRALPIEAVQTALGRTLGATTVISHLYASGSGSTLPITAPTELTNDTGPCPAIYLIE